MMLAARPGMSGFLLWHLVLSSERLEADLPGEDSPVPLGSFAPTPALDWGPQDFGISRYDTIVEALVEL